MTENARGMIAVDKMGGKVLFLNPATYATEVTIDGFPRTVHELLIMPEAGIAYVPIFGDGIHGRNPNPGHLVAVIDLIKRAHVRYIDMRPYIAPHTLRRGPDGLVYITCENSAVVAVIDPADHKVVEVIDSGSTNGHRLVISTDGRWLYTENEEDATISVIDLPNRKLVRKIATPRPLAGIALSSDDRTVVRSTTRSRRWFSSTLRRKAWSRTCRWTASRLLRRSPATARISACSPLPASKAIP